MGNDTLRNVRSQHFSVKKEIGLADTLRQHIVVLYGCSVWQSGIQEFRKWEFIIQDIGTILVRGYGKRSRPNAVLYKRTVGLLWQCSAPAGPALTKLPRYHITEVTWYVRSTTVH